MGEPPPAPPPRKNNPPPAPAPPSTVLDGNSAGRVFNIDQASVGGVDVSISGVTVTGGNDASYGGGGILDGSAAAPTLDRLTIDASVITGNTAAGGAAPGGGVQMFGGQLVITNSTISNNTAAAEGGGVYFQAQGVAGPETVSISGTTFSGNRVVASGGTGTTGGGALSLSGNGGAPATFTVSQSSFTGNSVAVSGGLQAAGGAIYQPSGTLGVSASTFTANSVSGPGAGAAVLSGGTSTLQYNRITGNVGPASLDLLSGSMNATENWWGCNGGPGAAGCDTVGGAATVSPRLVLSASAAPATVVGPNATATITAALTTDSLGAAVAPANLGAFDGLTVTFADPAGNATVSTSPGPHGVALAAGKAAIDYHSNTTIGPDPVNATFDGATVAAPVTVNQAPAITSPATTQFTAGTAGSFTVTSTGYPSAALTVTGTLPPGLAFTDNGNGSATLAGTPTGGGSFPVTLTAANGVGSNATQALTITVGQPPAFTSAAAATFTVGSPGSFTITTSGVPAVSGISESGALPAGLTFTDNGNGTAKLTGTPTGTGAGYPLTLTATNGVAPDGTQAFTLQVDQAPAVTTDPSGQTVNPGTPVTFTAAASGYPVPSVQWQRSTDGGASFSNLAGATGTSYALTTVAGDNGNEYRAVFTNVAGSAVTAAAVLNVGTAPAFSSVNAVTFKVGTPGSFTITTSGVPSATLSRTGTFPSSWLTLADNGDGTGTLSGTPPAGAGGTYTFTLKAANGFAPSATQIFTLSVDESPAITSANGATFVVGVANTFSVTTTDGYPLATAITETGALPAGLALVDNGDGTATLSGTAAAGTAGSYPLTITATATGGSTAPSTQSFTLTVNGPPTFTSANHVTFAVGTAGTFTVTTMAGHPAATTLTKSGLLPSGVSFTDNGNGTATIAGTPNPGAGGQYTLTLTASNGIAPNRVQTFTLTVDEPPKIASADHVTFTFGAAAAFTVTTSGGEPTSIGISESGSLPSGITFTDNHNGTATIGGTPAVGGVYPVTITATNGVLPDAKQTFTITVNASPSIASPAHASFAVGSPGSFSVTTTVGTPPATTITETGTLPAGVSFTDNGDGTALLAGTPAAHTGGAYPITIAASNGVNPNAQQSFTLTVTDVPVITSVGRAAFTAGTAGLFTVTTQPGFPTATALAQTGALPAGVIFSDNGDGTATLAGTPSAGTGGTYPLGLSAANSAGHTNQPFTLTVLESPTISSADHASFTAGTSDSFTVTTAGGFPTPPSLTETGALPAGVTFTDNGDGTADLAGVPGGGGIFAVTVTASNGRTADAVQNFTLTVNGPPAITSSAGMTFTAGVRGTFTVTTRAGVPAGPVTMSSTGALPAGITFTDNGNGTATLAGTARSSAIGSYPLTLVASNGIPPDASQSFTLKIARAQAVTLPVRRPHSGGPLHGVPHDVHPGELLRLTGSGFASGAPVTVGFYSTPLVLARTVASAAGTISVTVRVPQLLGSHTVVAGAVGATGTVRYLEAATQVSAPPVQPVPPPAESAGSSGGGSLANTGPDTDPAQTLGFGMVLMLAGAGLLVLGRRRRQRS
jgi:LPXTG-motif cell wall-anchored protein